MPLHFEPAGEPAFVVYGVHAGEADLLETQFGAPATDRGSERVR
jgi:hypothetical protein